MMRMLALTLVLGAGSSAHAAINTYIGPPKTVICKTGKPCGTTCIPKAKVCHRPPSIPR